MTPTRGPRAAAVAATAAALVAASVLAWQPLPELRLAAGQAATGDVVFDGEEDRVEADLLAGSALTFTAKASKRSPLVPAIDMLDAAGTPQPVDAALRKTTPQSASIKKWPVPATGTYLLAVRGAAAGVTGAYELTTGAKPAPPPPPAQGSIDAPGEEDEAAFDALAETVLAIALETAKGSDLIPRAAPVLGADGAPRPLDDPAVTHKQKETSDAYKGVALPLLGTYRVIVAGGAVRRADGRSR